LGLSASHVASTAAEPIACAIPVVLVLFYWAARLAIDPGAAEGGRVSLAAEHTPASRMRRTSYAVKAEPR
jgi:hypothetical protein